MTGAMSYHGGHAAEDGVQRHYQRRGFRIRDRCWRGGGGELDIVCENGDGLVFVEVKSAATHARASHRLSARQIARIVGAASQYVAAEPAGQDTPMRFDLALVDRHGMIEIVENYLI